MKKILASIALSALLVIAAIPLNASLPTDLARLKQQVDADMQKVDLQKVTIFDLQNLVKTGKLTYKELTQMYLNRIELYDFNTVKLNSVRILNPNALADAEKCDQTFAANPSVAKGLFGMPILIKDNINVVGMPTTAGSVALADNYAPYDAFLVTKLKEAGAVILGKVNLTEFANYIAVGMTTGFSSLAGQVLNPYRPVQLPGDTMTMRPSGSSAGSGVAAAAAFSTITVGTETSGSILSPSFTNSIVGIKPTVGLISRYGAIPISSTQDIAGPMGRNVTDAAVLLNVLAGYDPHDESTKAIEKAGATNVDYTKSLKLGNLKGKRVGLVGIPPKDNPAYAAFQQVLQILKDAGVTIVTKPDGSALTYYNPKNPNVNPSSPRTIVMDYDFAKDLPAYLATLDKNYPIKTLQNVIDFNNEYIKTNPSAFPFGQAILERCNVLDLELRKDLYLADRQRDIAYSRNDGIDYLLAKHNLHCIISTSNTGSTTVIAAKAGYPTVSIPLANPGGTRYPINLHFTGTAFSEAELIEFAYTIEQATNFRIPPDFSTK
jgi:amidase